jgi:hypothetical protein
MPDDKHKQKHDHTPAEERKIREAALDETIEESFPASDPPSSIPNPDNHEAFKKRQAPLKQQP